MEIPIGVQQAIKAIWISLALSVLAALGNIWMGEITQGYFLTVIFVYALYCIFPYKMSKRSNPTRWVYVVLSAITFLTLLSGDVDQIPKLDLISFIVIVPIEIFILYRLFQRDSTIWFRSK